MSRRSRSAPTCSEAATGRKGVAVFLDITEELLHAPVTELAPLLRERKITSAALTDA